jgi:GNAT superfamily N-acetyltransferase
MNRDIVIKSVEEVGDVAACYPAMRQLRPHLDNEAEFVKQVLRQRESGYRQSAAWRRGKVIGVVGYRFQHNLLYGRFVYVDDLVVDQDIRGGGVGAQLLEVSRSYARELNCSYLVLDTGMQKALAQRFYFRQGLLAHSLGFSEKLREDI